MHCDAMLPSGYGNSGGGNKYSRNIISMLIAENIPFLYFTEQLNSNLETFGKLGTDSYFYRICLKKSSLERTSIAYVEKIVEAIDSVLCKYTTYSFVFHSIYWYSGMIAENLSNKYNSYFIHTVISNEMSKIAQKAADKNALERCNIEQYIFNKARYIICSSESEAIEVSKYYSVNANKVIVTGRIIEKEFIYPYQDIYGNPQITTLSSELPIQYMENSFPINCEVADYEWQHIKAFIYVGRIHENKGISYIIEAWIRLYNKYKNHVPPLWIVGGTPKEITSFKKSFIKDIDILLKAEQEHKVVWWGVLPPAGISILMSKSYALIAHSKYEAGGNVILEAMAHALPIIATSFGYARDYVHHGQNGYLVQYSDIISLSRYMEYFILQPYLSNYMGRVAANDLKEATSEWHFQSKHLKMYGYENVAQSYVSEINIVPLDSINTYFDQLMIPDKQFIHHFITSQTAHKIVFINELGNVRNYYLWEIVTEKFNGYFYYLYSILDRRCLSEKRKNYIITKQQRIHQLEQKCNKNNIAIFFLDKNKGMAYLNQRMEIDL